MIPEILELLEAQPFRPFYIHTSGGKRYRVATADHASLSPKKSQTIVWFDDEGSITLAGLHIVGVEKEPIQAEQPA